MTSWHRALALGVTTALAAAAAVLAPSAAGAATPPTAHAQAAATTAYLTIDSKTEPDQSGAIGTTFIVTGTLRSGGRGIAGGVVELWERNDPGTVWVHTQNTRTTTSGAYAFAETVSRNALWQTRFPGSATAARATSRAMSITARFPFPVITMRGCDITGEGFARRISSTMRTTAEAAGATAVLQNGYVQPIKDYFFWQAEYASDPTIVTAGGAASATVVTPPPDDAAFSSTARWKVSGTIASTTYSTKFSGFDPDRSHWGDPNACFTMPIDPTEG